MLIPTSSNAFYYKYILIICSTVCPEKSGALRVKAQYTDKLSKTQQQCFYFMIVEVQIISLLNWFKQKIL